MDLRKLALLTLPLLIAAVTQRAHALGSCAVEVTRERNETYFACYERLGPKAPAFRIDDRVQQARLEQCLLNAHKTYKKSRKACAEQGRPRG